MNYNYNHLYYFYVAAKSGGITIAADHLHISQPSLSSQLKVLGETLDLKLFEKVGRKNQLTPTGTVLFNYCKKMFELAEEMTGAVSKSTPISRRKIQIGVADDVEKEFVIEVVSHFLNKYSPEERPQIHLSSGGLGQLVDHLRFKEVDTIITGKKIEKRVVFECDSVSALIRSVHNNLGFSFIPLKLVENEIKENYLKCLGPVEGLWNYDMTVSCHAFNKEDPLIHIFSNTFQELCEKTPLPIKSSLPFIEQIQINA